VNITSTTTTTTATTVTSAYATPTEFNIYYRNTDGTRSFGQAFNSSSGGTLVTFGGRSADTFGLDTQNRLDDVTRSREFVSTNAQDPFPFLFLGSTAAVEQTPICSACNNTLNCQLPNQTDNVFGVCVDFLSLGSPSDFNDPRCRIIDLLLTATT